MSNSFSVGQKVTMNNGFVEGIVTATMTEGNGDTCRVSWWDGNQRRESWFHPAEIKADNGPAEVKADECCVVPGQCEPAVAEITPAPEEAPYPAA